MKKRFDDRWIYGLSRSHRDESKPFGKCESIYVFRNQGVKIPFVVNPKDWETVRQDDPMWIRERVLGIIEDDIEVFEVEQDGNEVHGIGIYDRFRTEVFMKIYRVITEWKKERGDVEIEENNIIQTVKNLDSK